RWAQRAETSQLELDGPLGVGGVRLEFANGRLPDEATRSELERRLGFALPVGSLRYWMLGVPDPTRVAKEALAADATRLDSLQQDGWTVSFPAYARVAGANYELPQRIEASRAGVRVRLLVESWGVTSR
ncbi:MAG: outer membrane lipoprotein LolB, partial [Gammaproteobacteria bacterium]|nr:outer membrane lipoprotein LolB [Gammaproteobacteria bacterium]